MLDQELATSPLGLDRSLELSRGVELVVAGEDDAPDLPLGVPPSNEVAAEDFKPALAFPDFLPEIAGRMPLRVRRVAIAAIVPLVEGQEAGGGSGELRSRVDFAVAHREVDKRPGGEGEQRLVWLAFRPRITVEAVLVDRIRHTLGKVG